MFACFACSQSKRTHGKGLMTKASYSADACVGLMQVHSGGLLHRDMAARNCLVNASDVGTFDTHWERLHRVRDRLCS